MLSMMRSCFCTLVFGSVLAHFSIAAPLKVSGVTEPFMDVELSAPVQGTIALEHFSEGAEVQEGQVILELDSALEELETQRRKEVMERSRTDFEATQTLFSKTKAVSQEELDKRRMEYKVAAAEYGIAEEQLKRRKIVAPFSGTIVELFLKPGASCEPHRPLVRLVDVNRCHFIGHIEGTSASSLKLEQPVKIQVAGLEASVPAVITFISPVVDSASGLARIKALFENADRRVRPGLPAQLLAE